MTHLSAALLVAGVVCSVGLMFACYMLIRNDAVYKERTRWLDEHLFPEPGDPDFWAKLRLVSSGMELHRVVPYNEMYGKFWIPVHRWRAIAQSRVDSIKQGKALAG